MVGGGNMRTLVAARDLTELPVSRIICSACVPIHKHPIHFAIVDVEEPSFSSERDGDCVLIRVKGFSLNYRDHAFLPISKRLPQSPNSDLGLGSEFVGHVLAVGSSVSDHRVGDRVIAQMAWPSDSPSILGGVPTNAASREVLKLHRNQLLKIPPNMPDEVAGAFSLGAQTAYAMVRRLEIRPRENVLVTAATSNTSLFAIQLLSRMEINLVALTSKVGVADQLRSLGVSRVVEISSPSDLTPLKKCSRELGGFNAILDPFSDVYMHRLASLMTFFARYVTCGVSFSPSRSPGVSERTWADTARQLVFRNATVIGSSLGLRDDLSRALEDYRAGRLDVLIDSVHGADELETFVCRTFTAADRLGKVVYMYN